MGWLIWLIVYFLLLILVLVGYFGQRITEKKINTLLHEPDRRRFFNLAWRDLVRNFSNKPSGFSNFRYEGISRKNAPLDDIDEDRCYRRFLEYCLPLYEMRRIIIPACVLMVVTMIVLPPTLTSDTYFVTKTSVLLWILLFLGTGLVLFYYLSLSRKILSLLKRLGDKMEYLHSNKQLEVSDRRF